MTTSAGGRPTGGQGNIGHQSGLAPEIFTTARHFDVVR